jgi:hypothetical protein
MTYKLSRFPEKPVTSIHLHDCQVTPKNPTYKIIGHHRALAILNPVGMTYFVNCPNLGQNVFCIVSSLIDIQCSLDIFRKSLKVSANNFDLDGVQIDLLTYSTKGLCIMHHHALKWMLWQIVQEQFECHTYNAICSCR